MLTLVTGATGLLGNNVCRLLLEQGQAVRVLARVQSDPRPLAGLPLQIVPGDIRDPNEVALALAGVDRVIHAAAQVRIGWSQRELAHQVNVQGTQHVAQAARERGVRMVHVSSVDALGVGRANHAVSEDEPPVGKIPCPYVETKQLAEGVVREEIQRGLAAVIVNPGFMLGPWDWRPSSGKMLLDIGRISSPMAPRGGCSTCDVRDVAAAILVALERGSVGRRYILAGENITYLELWRTMARIAGSRPPRFRMGPLVRWSAGAIGDLIGQVTREEPAVNSAAIAMSNLFHYYSSDRARSELDYQPRPAEQSIVDAWAWFREFGYA